MTVGGRVWQGIRLGVTVGLISGVIVGLIGGVGGDLFTDSLPDSAAFAVNAFWALIVVLPLVYALLSSPAPAPDSPRERRYTLTAAGWLPAFVTSIVAFMMPVVMVPLLMNRGVTIENSADWYAQVYTPLLDWRIGVIAVGTLLGFAFVDNRQRS